MCNSMGPYIYTIVNDYNRMKFSNVSIVINNTTKDQNQTGPFILTMIQIQFSTESISIIVIIILIDILLPIIAVYKDRKDYKDIKLDKYDEVTDEFLIKIAIKKH